MSIGETISAARETQGMTQSDLAGKVFVTRQTVSRWETFSERRRRQADHMEPRGRQLDTDAQET